MVMLYMVLINLLVIVSAVLIHYEFLYRMTLIMPAIKLKNNIRILFGVLGALVAHSIEVWLFAIVYYLLGSVEGWGYLSGNFDGTLLDCVYFSYTSFTTLGFGDITPYGPIKHLSGLESLCGLLLITWTASFLFMEMQRQWQRR